MSNLWRNLRDITRKPENVQTQPSLPDAANVLSPETTGLRAPIRGGVRQPRKSDDEGLANLVEMQQCLIAQQHQEMQDMAQHLAEKDKILLEKESEIKKLKHLPSVSEFDNFEVEYWRNVHCEEQNKFLALYHHACNLADERDAMIEVERKRKDTIKQQVVHIKHLNTRIASLVHEDNLEHLAKQQSNTTYSSSDTASVASRKDDSQDKNFEIDIGSVSSTQESHDRHSIVNDERRQEESQSITRMLTTVDRLARHYSPPDRYESSSTVIDSSESRSGPVKMFSWVHTEMLAMWVYAVEEEVTPEEEEQYTKFLQKQLRPPPIHSPHLKKPMVNWNKLNPFQFKNLPQPSPFPVQGCSPDPEFYLAIVRANDSYGTKSLKWLRSDNKSPFGYLYGFSTNMGIVPVPDQVIHGYRCNPNHGNWQIDAKG